MSRVVKWGGGILVVSCLVFGFFYFKDENTRMLSSSEIWNAAQSYRFGALPKFSQKDLELAQLGRQIFNDPRFSSNGKVSCATCHQSQRSFTDGLVVAQGVGRVHRNTPTLINSFMGRWFFWDGRADSLESQASGPLEAPLEHGISRTQVARLVLKEYREQYESLFGEVPAQIEKKIPEQGLPKGASVGLSENMAGFALATLKNETFYKLLVTGLNPLNLNSTDRLNHYLQTTEPELVLWQKNYAGMDHSTEQFVNQVLLNISRALAAFERGLVAVDSPFDRFVASWSAERPPEMYFTKDFDKQAYRGLNIFLSKGRCFLCHGGPNFTDGEFHNIGLPDERELGLGRALGAVQVKANPLNCQNPWWARFPEHRERESCQELPFLDTENLEILGAYKTPTLRNLAQTGPYTHAGRFQTLEEVIDHYNELAVSPAIGHREETLKPLLLTNSEKKDLLKFLDSLNSEVKDLTATSW